MIKEPGESLDSSLDFLCDLSLAISISAPRRKICTMKFLSFFSPSPQDFFVLADYKLFTKRTIVLSVSFQNV